MKIFGGKGNSTEALNFSQLPGTKSKLPRKWCQRENKRDVDNSAKGRWSSK